MPSMAKLVRLYESHCALDECLSGPLGQLSSPGVLYQDSRRAVVEVLGFPIHQPRVMGLTDCGCMIASSDQAIARDGAVGTGQPYQYRRLHSRQIREHASRTESAAALPYAVNGHVQLVGFGGVQCSEFRV